jgi:hypothetical protein
MIISPRPRRRTRAPRNPSTLNLLLVEVAVVRTELFEIEEWFGKPERFCHFTCL